MRDLGLRLTIAGREVAGFMERVFSLLDNIDNFIAEPELDASQIQLGMVEIDRDINQAIKSIEKLNNQVASPKSSDKNITELSKVLDKQYKQWQETSGITKYYDLLENVKKKQEEHNQQVDKTAALWGKVGAAISGLSLGALSTAAFSFAQDSARAYEALSGVTKTATAGLSEADAKKISEFINGPSPLYVDDMQRAQMMAMMTQYGMPTDTSMSLVSNISALYSKNKDAFGGMTPQDILFRASRSMFSSKSAVGGSQIARIAGENYFNEDAKQEFIQQFSDMYPDMDEESLQIIANMEWLNKNVAEKIKQQGATMEQGAEYPKKYDAQMWRYGKIINDVQKSWGESTSPLLGSGMAAINDTLEMMRRVPGGDAFIGTSAGIKDLATELYHGIGGFQTIAILMMNDTLLARSSMVAHGALNMVYSAGAAIKAIWTGTTVASTTATAANATATEINTVAQTTNSVATGGGVAARAAAVAGMIAATIASYSQATATGVVTAAQWALNVALTANPIGIIIVAVAALAAGLYILEQRTGAISRTYAEFGNMVEAIGSGDLGKALDIFKGSPGLRLLATLAFPPAALIGLTDSLPSIQSLTEKTGNDIASLAKQTIPDLLGQAVDFLEWIVNSVTSLPGTLVTMFWNSPLGQAITSLQTLITGLASKLGITLPNTLAAGAAGSHPAEYDLNDILKDLSEDQKEWLSKINDGLHLWKNQDTGERKYSTERPGENWNLQTTLDMGVSQEQYTEAKKLAEEGVKAIAGTNIANVPATVIEGEGGRPDTFAPPENTIGSGAGKPTGKVQGNTNIISGGEGAPDTFETFIPPERPEQPPGFDQGGIVHTRGKVILDPGEQVPNAKVTRGAETPLTRFLSAISSGELSLEPIDRGNAAPEASSGGTVQNTFNLVFQLPESIMNSGKIDTFELYHLMEERMKYVTQQGIGGQ